EISLYAWGPQHVMHPKGAGHPEPDGSATHHLDVRVYDLHRRLYIPYLNVTATVSDRTKKREFTVELEPMIGEWLHYGGNIALPHPGTYSILIDVQPPDIARHKHLTDVWNTPVQTVFTFEYR
ncbi:MAG: iron transporter, partial [Dehalococcoidia bacterium]